MNGVVDDRRTGISQAVHATRQAKTMTPAGPDGRSDQIPPVAGIRLLSTVSMNGPADPSLDCRAAISSVGMSGSLPGSSKTLGLADRSAAFSHRIVYGDLLMLPADLRAESTRPSTAHGWPSRRTSF